MGGRGRRVGADRVTARTKFLRVQLRTCLLALAVLSLPFLALWSGPSDASGSLGWQWFKTDTHVHGVVSSDAISDVGIIAEAAKAKGYNAIFLTDHQGGSNFPISGIIASHVDFDDALGTKWTVQTHGSLSSSANALVSSPVTQGSKSLRLRASSASWGETSIYKKRGPNLRSGDLILAFSVYPTRIDAGTGAYVSVAIGGDSTVESPDGYTTQAGIPTLGKSTVLVWQLGQARAASSDPNARVPTHDLPYTLTAWNHYVVNVTTGAVTHDGVAVASGNGLGDIPLADRALDYNALQQLKMAVAASAGGTAEAYFDAYRLDAQAELPAGDEYAYRNTQVHAFDTSTFKVLPSIEMGVGKHVQRFNFAITSGSEYASFFQCSDALMTQCTINQGTAGIAPAQQTGYPVQLNHPNVPGGVKLDEIAANDYQVFGADAMEVRPDNAGVPPTTMVDIWDEALKRGRPLIGTWSSDTHKASSLTGTRVATYLYAPALEFDSLMRSLFEGRVYVARNSFSGRVLLNLDSASQEPYPARYPIYVSDTATSANVHLAITGGISSGSSVRWIVGGSELVSEPASGSYETTKSISLAGATRYVRAQLHHSGSTPLNYAAMTEAIVFLDVPGLPTDMRFQVNGITTPDGRGYTKLLTKGITAASWGAAASSLSLTLQNPAGSVVELGVLPGARLPSTVVVDGVPVPQAGSQAAFDAATGSSWYYDALAGRLEVKVHQSGGTAQVGITLAANDDTEAPTVPAGLSATAIGGTQVQLGWTASSDNIAVSGYTIYRDGTQVAVVGANTLTWNDSAVSPGQTHSYTVDAYDPAGNHSAPSSAVSVTMPAAATATFDALADAYVDANSPSTTYGASSALKVDTSPTVNSYLRFDVQGLQGSVSRATLRVWATSSRTEGYDVRGVADNTWGEASLTYANAPA